MPGMRSINDSAEAGRPRCSVVIRCYNEREHIGRLLEGVLEQTVRDVQIVVVDSGSTDGTLEALRHFPVEVVRIAKEDFSFGYALNEGCRAARGEFLVFASAHVYPTYRDWLERLLFPFADPRVALVYGKQRGDHRTRFSERQVFRTWFPDQSRPRQDHPFCNNANAAVRRELWEVMPYDESLTGLEDIAWGKRVLSRGYRIAYAADAEIVHVHEESASQIFRRYEREAIGLRSIYPESSFSFWNFFRMTVGNVWNDWGAARREGSLTRNMVDVVVFRALQFWGTYRGYAQHGPIGKQLRTRFYYPPETAVPEPEERPRADATPIDYVLALGSRVGDEPANPVSEPTVRPRIIDISPRFDDGLPVWPGSPGFRLSPLASLESGSPANVSKLELELHTGTHIDAPRHFLPTGSTVEEIPLELLLGPAVVSEVAGARAIGPDALDRLAVPHGTERLLLRTVNSELWRSRRREFDPDFAALSLEGARWVVERRIRLLGIDYLSVQRFEDGPETHRVLLEAGVLLLEGLDLSAVTPGWWELVCLPLALVGAEAAPARAVLRRMRPPGSSAAEAW